jgi:hypothetical protein
VSFQSSFIATRPCMGSTGGVRSGHVQCTAAFGSRGPRRLRSTLDARVPKRHSNPIADRIRRKRQRLPSSLLIETASARLYALAPAFCAEALPIKPSDHPDTIASTDLKRSRYRKFLWKTGNPIGRPRRIFNRDEVVRLRGAGLSIEKMANQMRIGIGTVVRVRPEEQRRNELITISYRVLTHPRVC